MKNISIICQAKSAKLIVKKKYPPCSEFYSFQISGIKNSPFSFCRGRARFVCAIVHSHLIDPLWTIRVRFFLNIPS